MSPPERAGSGRTPGKGILAAMLVDDHGRQLRIAAYGLAIRDQMVLLTRLAPEELDFDHWTLPGGGLEWGEHPIEGLRREFVEETGLVPTPIRPLVVHSYALTVAQRRSAGPAIQVIQIVYLVDADGDPTHEIGGSTVEARWWPLHQLEMVPLVELVGVALGFNSDTREPPD
ncbi:MAG: NUDIX hydrolase [Actinomycetota bacterium]